VGLSKGRAFFYNAGMTFWAYMLHCRGGAFYVGHTDNLDDRIGQHQSGLIGGYSADHLPVELVWSRAFATRHEAKTAEKQIKGWSRSKKLALIRGGVLAFSPDLSSPPVCRELVEGLSFTFRPHPQTPPSQVRKIQGLMGAVPETGAIRIEYQVDGASDLAIPSPLLPMRADELWRTTCFELFVKRAGDQAYTEYNFSPSGEWSVYQFDGYRTGMHNAPAQAPCIGVHAHGTNFTLDVTTGPILPAGDLHLALSAVIEETGGTKSYWALAHPPGPPDFHHPDCFALHLPAPDDA